jgi:hypothetical protein
MRLHDGDANREISQLSLLVTKSEAEILIEMLKALITNPEGNHQHLWSTDYQRVLNVAVYDLNRIDQFHPDIRVLLEKDSSDLPA